MEDDGGYCLAASAPPTKGRECSAPLPIERWRNSWKQAHLIKVYT